MQNWFKCPCCEAKVVYERLIDKKGEDTHAWFCQGLTCPFIAYEYLSKKDTERLSERLDPVTLVHTKR